MKKIITIKVYFMSNQIVDRITYIDNVFNEEFELIDHGLINHIQKYWGGEPSLDIDDDYVDFSIDGEYLICNSCNKKIEIGQTFDESVLDQLYDSFYEIHKMCKEYLENN